MQKFSDEVARLLAKLTESGLNLTVSDDGVNLIVEPRSAITNEHRANIRRHKPALLALLIGQAHAPPDFENIVEDFQERAAILEYDAGMPRPEAEAQAYRRIVVKYKLNEYYGNPPLQGGGTAIGRPDETAEDVWNGLRERYGARLCEPEPLMTNETNA